MEQLFKKLSKIGSYVFIAAISFFVYNILQLNLDAEYSVTHGSLLKASIAHADSPPGDDGTVNNVGGDGGGAGGDGGAGCGSGGSGDSSAGAS